MRIDSIDRKCASYYTLLYLFFIYLSFYTFLWSWYLFYVYVIKIASWWAIEIFGILAGLYFSVRAFVFSLQIFHVLGYSGSFYEVFVALALHVLCYTETYL